MSTMRNSVMLIGRPGADPEMKNFDNNQRVARFRLAVNEAYTNEENERIENTQWISITAWNGLADRVMKIVRKGFMVAIEGSLRNNEWTDKDGNRRSTVEVVLSDMMPVDFEKKQAD